MGAEWIMAIGFVFSVVGWCLAAATVIGYRHAARNLPEAVGWADLGARIQRLQQEQEALQRRRDALDDELTALTAERRQSATEKAEQEAELRGLRSEKRLLVERISGLKEELRKTELACARAAGELEQMRQRLEA